MKKKNVKIKKRPNEPQLSRATLGAAVAMIMVTSSQAAFAQTTVPETKSMGQVEVKAKYDEESNRYNRNYSNIGKITQEISDIPQAITVIPEGLLEDQNATTLKDGLRNVPGLTFNAGEGGRIGDNMNIRGFYSFGDLYVDGIRDTAQYNRDLFNVTQVDVLRGAASMLFGRGSTGGAVNMVNKVPRLMDENQIDVTVGSHNHRRVVGDFNQQTGESSALRVSAMKTTADNNGAGSRIDKQGLAGSYRWGIGERDEFTASLYRLENNNGINYGMPWIKPTSTSPASATTLLPVSPTSNYGMASDYNDGTATYATLAHTHRFDGDTELTTRVRRGAYTRDQRASTIRLTAGENLSNFGPSTVLTRGTQNKIQDLDSVYWQSDLSAKFDALGVRHELLSGIDVAREQKTVYAARTAAQGLGGVDPDFGGAEGQGLGGADGVAGEGHLGRLGRPLGRVVPQDVLAHQQVARLDLVGPGQPGGRPDRPGGLAEPPVAGLDAHLQQRGGEVGHLAIQIAVAQTVLDRVRGHL